MKNVDFKSFTGAKNYAMHISLMLLGTLVVFTACQDDASFMAGSEEGIIAQFRTASSTRVIDEPYFDAGDSVGIYSVKWIDYVTPGELKASGNRQDNCLIYQIDGNDNWEYVDPIYLPAGGESVDLYAYYPYMDQPMNPDATLKVSVRPDQSKLIDYKRSDFSTALARGINLDNNQFTYYFYHRLSQIQFQLVAGSNIMIDDLLAAEIKLKNVITDASYSYADNEIHPGTTRSDIIPCGTLEIVDNKVVGKTGIIIPQTLGSQSELEITIGSSTYTKEFIIDETLQMGESYIVSATVNISGIEIDIYSLE